MKNVVLHSLVTKDQRPVHPFRRLFDIPAKVTTPRALIRAARDGHIDVVRQMLQEGADPNRFSASTTALMHASMYDHIDIVQFLLTVDGIDVNGMGRDGRTALMCAATTGQTAIVEMLIHAGANPHRVHPTSHTPLIRAARGGYVEIVRILLRQGVDVNYAPRRGWPGKYLWPHGSRGDSIGR